MRVHDIHAAIDRHRFPVDPWRLVEAEPGFDDLGLVETLFATANGYLGMRANPPEGRDAHAHGTFVNGFHETWPIHHAESAFAFAKTGQTIINVPDAKLLKLYVDDEPLLLRDADLDAYERVLDFRTGVAARDLVWRTPGGKRVRVRSEQMVSLQHRHLAVLCLEVTVLDGTAPVVVSSQLLNRQDGIDEYHVSSASLGEGTDPRQARRFDRRVLEPRLGRHEPLDRHAGGRVTLGYRCARSGMTIAAACQHELTADATSVEVETTIADDLAKTVFAWRAEPGRTVRITKYVAYHTSRGVPCEELADRCRRTLDRAASDGHAGLLAEQQSWLDHFWYRSDVVIDGDDTAQQAVRWNLFQLAQASARTHEQGIAAKGVTAAGYDGHYFWDTEVYVVPFLASTNPDAARSLLRFRARMLDAARTRAAELNQRGALFPWRTINGEEASAYYAAGTAQYHINAAVVYALERYVTATGDRDFLSSEGAEILVETARLYEDLGFFSTAREGSEEFHIHGVTGPDEYTTVVNDNLYTNVMARFTMRFAARVVEELRIAEPARYEHLVRATGVSADEVASWNRACDAMYLPYDDRLGIHPQDASFLDREPWDFAGTPADRYPLLLHFHPLVIYRHQVLKQADVVLAMFLRGEHFSVEEKRRNFDYYDPITTGDSSLSACVQSIVAAEVGHDDLARQYFEQALYLDLADTHGNTSDGVHVANAGGVWSALVHGFAGYADDGEAVRLAPRVPAGWTSLRFRIGRGATSLLIELDADGGTITVEEGPPVDVVTDLGPVRLGPGERVRIERLCVDGGPTVR
ncbi:MAG: glycoside hydrolase family 65 protein [Ilumatobacteraceae bacterium]